MSEGAPLIPFEWRVVLMDAFDIREMTEAEKRDYQESSKAEQRQLALAAHAH